MAEIRITDISVSRLHSNLFLCRDGTLCVVDNFSKFGTMKLIREPLEVSSETQMPVYVQVGRVAMSISCKQTKTCWEKMNSCFKLKVS